MLLKKIVIVNLNKYLEILAAWFMKRMSFY